MRHEPGELVQALVLDALDRAGDRRMDSRPNVDELRAVGDLLGEGMLEGVFDVRIQAC